MPANVDIRAHVAHLVRTLLDGAGNHKELHECARMADSTVRLWLRAFHEAKVIRIGSWERYGNNGWKPVYEMNPDYLKDAPRPPKLTDAERTQRWRRQKANQRLRATVQ